MSDDGLASIAAWPGEHRAAGWRHVDGRTATAGDSSHPFRLASVTKVLSAVAILVATQEEIVDLDEPAGPPDATVRQLLSHAAGLPFDGREPIAAPGTRRSYGNGAFEILADLVADRAAMSFAAYVAAAVCEPLAMTATTVEGSPAHGARSTLEDLLRLCAELQAPGRVLAPELLAQATTIQQPELAGVLPGFGRQDPNPWGLGLEIRGEKSPHWTPPEASVRTFGHFGQSGCFLWVDPDAGVACVGLADAPFGDWAAPAWREMGSLALTAAQAVR
ncbi:MAG: serine hydrolase domain-containing protein [Acidimicrobiales bacterium]